MELSMEWPSMVISLESLRPLSPNNFDDETIAQDVDKLSRSELAGKLLDHFDGIQQEESDPFSWYTHEKSVEIPIFESLPSPPYKIDLKLPFQANIYLDPDTTNAGDYQEQPAHQPTIYNLSSSLASDTFNALSPLYSSVPASQHLEPPPAVVPLAQPSSASVEPAAASCSSDHVKLECVPGTTAPASATSSNVEWLKRETLTPPESPKAKEEILKILGEFESAELEHLMRADNCQLAPLATPALFVPESTSCASPVAHSDDGNSRSLTDSPSDMSDDPEWTPPIRHSPSRVSKRRNDGGNSKQGTSLKSVARDASAVTSKKRSKPYLKPGVDEQRQRKKEQNKNAATRYRLKKKAEVVEVKMEENQLEDYNAKLRKELDELCREVGYLKSLMRELYRKKGLIK